MQMEAVKSALQDLLAAMDSEDKRVLQERLAGGKPSAMPEKACDCGKESCSCGKGGAEVEVEEE